jgi:hypothetical protein
MVHVKTRSATETVSRAESDNWKLTVNEPNRFLCARRDQSEGSTKIGVEVGVGEGAGLAVGDDLGFGGGEDADRGGGGGLEGVGPCGFDAEATTGPLGLPTIFVSVPRSAATISPLFPFMPSAHAPVPRRCALFARRAFIAMEDASS